MHHEYCDQTSPTKRVAMRGEEEYLYPSYTRTFSIHEQIA